ncbi:chromatin assembly factor 1 subunit FAS1 [Malania oleifera]|uniref:chromatin assembly factor 1 subunit FAS1 n=1 Tax=Malania oleifera TaxID=397392 RepID=UPI0025AE8559|nr:chromatin assembly factor 1 subunit FAS1 [Malania oleifera]
MAETMLVDGEVSREPKMNDPNQAKNTLKRKRASSLAAEWLSSEEREARVDGLRAELEGLFRYFKEVADQSVVAYDLLKCGSGSNLNSAIACLIEESSKPLSKLVEEVYEKVKNKEGMNAGITVASVKSSVLIIGQRSYYGVPNVDADLLEDETESSLWCWETRDLKLMPKSARGILKIRRTGRKKIHERITAVSSMMTALQKLDSRQNSKHDILKASEKLCKVLSEADIRLLVESMIQKNGADIAEKEVKREEKVLIKQLEKNKREAEKEKKRVDRELQKEKLQSEKELKRLKDEAEKGEKRRGKEESEMRKHLRRQQEEAGKDQRRREKEEAELKKQLAIQKQASIMERFLRRNKTNVTSQNEQSATKAMTLDSLTNRRGDISESVVQSMDCALAVKDEISIEGIRKSFIESWHCIGHSTRSNGKQHWGIRQKPKTKLIKELKLTTGREQAHDDEMNIEKLVDGWEATVTDEKLDNSLPHLRKCNRSKQLLQFDKSNRPAFYGIWPRQSQIVGPRHPFKKDPELDYDVDSDEEWEEEDPGESLSDCDKDEEEELEEGYPKPDDEDESEDGFFVPDGYLSENERGQVDQVESDLLSSPSCQQEFEAEEFCALLWQRKYLQGLTEHALRKNQPLIILNLLHDKTPLLGAEDLSGSAKVEQMCLQALSMCAFPGGPPIEMPTDNDMRDEDQEACFSNGKGSGTPVATVTAIPDSDLPKIVSAIQSCPQGINKVVESLQQAFPTISKSQLRNKVREISNFVDNCWQVKKDVLDKLGLSISPEKRGGRTRSIATFFSKRCHPPAGKCINSSEGSPESSQKTAPVVQQATGLHIQQSSLENLTHP